MSVSPAADLEFEDEFIAETSAGSLDTTVPWAVELISGDATDDDTRLAGGAGCADITEEVSPIGELAEPVPIVTEPPTELVTSGDLLKDDVSATVSASDWSLAVMASSAGRVVVDVLLRDSDSRIALDEVVAQSVCVEIRMLLLVATSAGEGRSVSIGMEIVLLSS